MQNSTEGTFQKHHQGPSVWHLEEEISFLLQETLSAIQGNRVILVTPPEKLAKHQQSLNKKGMAHLFLHYLDKNGQNPCINHLSMNLFPVRE